MAVKQRKGNKSKSVTPTDPKEKDYNADKNKGNAKPTKNKKHNRKSGMKVSFAKMLLIMTGFLSLVGSVIYYYYSKYGITILLGHGARDFKWTPYEWRNFIDENEKTVLLIGGPHRSGTTILWEAIKAHPEIVGFGSRFETGVDCSEGVLFQEVYPRFGVGLEFQDPLTLSKLLNRFAPFWDKSKKFESDGLKKAKVWVEKSPQNGVLSTFLEGIYNMPVKEDGSVVLTAGKPTRSATKFLYMTRHPIANVYAIDKFVKEAMGGYIDFEILLRNYIQLHKYMKTDEKNLDSPAMFAYLEDFTSNPPKVLKEVFGFLDVSTNDEIISGILESVGEVRSNPNRKYIKKWCEEGIKEHGYLLDKYRDDLEALDLGYDLDVCK